MEDIGIPSPRTLGTDLPVITWKIFSMGSIDPIVAFQVHFKKVFSQPSFGPSQKPILHNIK